MKKTFDVFNYEQSDGQTFSKAIIIKQGKEIDVDAMIQAGREDTEIYPTLEKYGCLDKLEIDKKGIYGDFRQIKNLQDLIIQNEKATQLWNNLPLEVREIFGNNKAEFINKGEEWLKHQIDADIKKSKKNQEKQNQNEIEIKENKNE